MAQTGKPVFVQALIPEAPVKRFDAGILIGLAGLDEEELNAIKMSPREYGTSPAQTREPTILIGACASGR